MKEAAIEVIWGLAEKACKKFLELSHKRDKLWIKRDINQNQK